jgi:hypothetical protein
MKRARKATFMDKILIKSIIIDSLDGVRSALKRGACLECRDHATKLWPMHVAVLGSPLNLHIIELLVQHGGDLLFKGDKNPCPLDLASYSVNADDFCALFQFCDITRLLTKSPSASVNFLGNIVGNGDIERMEKLLALPFAHMFDFDQHVRSLADLGVPIPTLDMATVLVGALNRQRRWSALRRLWILKIL